MLLIDHGLGRYGKSALLLLLEWQQARFSSLLYLQGSVDCELLLGLFQGTRA